MSPRTTGVLACAVAAGLALTASPASATPAESAYAIAAAGLAKIPRTPSIAGPGQESLASVALPDAGPSLVSAKALNAEVEPSHAKSSVAGLALDLGVLPGAAALPGLSAGVVKAECREGKGSVSIANLKVGGKAVKLDQVPPNTTVPLAPLLELVVNKQAKNDDGTLTVTAVSAKLLGKAQSLDIASATCAKAGAGGPEPSTPPKPAGDKPQAGGKAPKPTPVPAHLDVTG
ncbi:choice-of-anchor P family protein [Amycolatopsis magusensis]|uniref:choice-of-anchor P family protein n=1 Tax=Amycolatopsis magusensis TaxID=882444 RepID=UPI0024A87E93|nr:choice-of-anchor P family protein [Amycolatopsis magusensis]MDI5977035.1 choice-of-anchor P family protein [Amycolatopsis magusensis]